MRRSSLAALVLITGCATASAPSSGDEVQTELVVLEAQRSSAGQDSVRARQLFVRGLTRAQVGDPEAAVRLFEQALGLVPAQPAVFSALADVHAALAAPEMALFYVEAARAADPANPHYHRQAALLYRDAGRTTDAAAALEAVIVRRPMDYEALFELAALRTVRGEYAAALEAYARLRAVVGDTPEVLDPLLGVYVRLGDEAGIEATLRDLIAAAPTDPDAYRMLSTLLAGRGELAEAAAVLGALVAAVPEDAEATADLSELLRRLGRTDDADALVDDAPPDALVARAASLTARAPLDADAGPAAEALLRRALAQSPDHERALALLGRLRVAAGDAAEGAHLLRRALEANPRVLDRWSRTAEAFLAAEAPDEAVAVAEEGLLLFPGQPALLHVAARALLASGRTGAALARVREALTIVEEDAADAALQAALLTLLGDVLTRQGDAAGARAAWERAARLDPSDPALRERLEG